MILAHYFKYVRFGILGDAQYGTLGNHIIMIDKTGTPRVPTNMIRDNYKRAIFESGQFVWDTNALVTSVYKKRSFVYDVSKTFHQFHFASGNRAPWVSY